MNLRILFLCLVFILAGVYVADLVSSGNESFSKTSLSVSEKADNTLEQPIAFPGNTKKIMDTLFRFSSDEAITLRVLVLLIVVWGVLVLLLQRILSFVPLFEREWMSFAMAAIITSIASVMGTIRESVLTLLVLGDGLEFLRISGLLGFLLILLVVLVLTFFFSRAFSAIKRAGKISEAERTGFDASFRLPGR